ncbi:oligosaccharide flippase family protein [Aeromonas caviae]|uniref:oligosaccharide flippase family protein n=1 Tax=Aeromonas caviae TaxID=648 RepID=UPI00244A84F3|nr:oligosaccharide flippase family protein [Aeromonas caviae]MDH0026909.1 oligosaccharide flippase family protein [Aeromonas caviae]MDH1080400.1 oligosaccharide flippase family protein [Aeromonas caviae]
MIIKKMYFVIDRHFDILKNVIFLLFEKAAFIALIFYSEAVISRTLGVEDYGKWFYSVNFMLLVSSLALVVGTEIVVPALSKNQKLRWSILTSAFLVRIIFSIMAFATINTYNYFFIEDDVIKQMIALLSFVLLFTEPFGVIINYYQSKLDIGFVVLARLFALITRALVITLASWLSYNWLIYCSRSIEAILLAVFLCILIMKSGASWTFSKKITRLMFYRGLRLWAPLVFMYAYMRSDRFFVEHYLGFDDLAMYGVAIQIFEQLGLLIGIIIQSIGPKLIFKKVALPKWKVISFISLITVCVQLFSAMLLPIFIDYIYGESYNQAASMVVHMLPALIFYSIDTVYMQYIYRKGFYELVLVKWLIMLVISISAYYLWFAVFEQTSVVYIFNFNYLVMLLITLTVYYIHNKNQGF